MARGSVRKRYDHVWYAIYDDPDSGKQKWERIGRDDVPKGHHDYANKAMAEAHLNEVMVSIDKGSYVCLPDLKFDEFAKKFLEVHADQVKQSTLTKYKTHLNYKIIPYFKSYRLKSIRPYHIQEFLQSLKEEDMTPINRKKYLVTLKLVLNKACDLGYIAYSPAQKIKAPKIKTKPKFNYLSPAEMNLLIKHTDGKHRVLIMFACRTGLRQNEQLFVLWDDIDFNGGYVYVRENDLRGLKSESSERKVPLEPELLEALNVHKLKQMETLKAGQNPDNLVFTSSTGTALNPSNLDRRILTPALTMAGLRKVRWHDLRHSYATALLSSGEPIAYVSKKLGHADPSITLKVYTHVLPETEEDEHQRHGEIFKGAEISSKTPILAVH